MTIYLPCRICRKQIATHDGAKIADPHECEPPPQKERPIADEPTQATEIEGRLLAIEALLTEGLARLGRLREEVTKQ